MVIFHPKNPSIIITIYWLIKGEVIKNEKVTPNGMPTSKKLKKIGIDEQEQNGVIAPKSEAKRFPNALLLVIQALTLL